MKKIGLLFLGICMVFKLSAQTNDTLPKAYIGISTGINNINALLGANLTLRVHDNILVRGGVGLGGWGTKYSIGLRYDVKNTSGWAYCLGYSVCPGISEVKGELETVSGVKKEVTIDYQSASTLNFSFLKNWKVGRSNNFYLEFGYALPLVSEPWKVKNGDVLSSTSKAALKIIQPGGLIFGVGFAFGI